MRLFFVIVFVSAFAGGIARAEPMTQDQCVAAFLGSANKDWKGYDNCVRAATQLKLRNASGAANKNMMTVPTTPPNAGGAAATTDTGSH